MVIAFVRRVTIDAEGYVIYQYRKDDQDSVAFGPAVSKQVLTSKTYNMSFQILNKEGEALTMNELDREAAAFWNKEVHTKHYASPPANTEGMSEIDKIRSDITGNWFDVIGYQIHSPEDARYTSGWNNVKCSLWTIQSKGWYSKVFNWSIEEMEIYMKVTKDFLKPYYDLIDHWEAKGYQPQQVNE